MLRCEGITAPKPYATYAPDAFRAVSAMMGLWAVRERAIAPAREESGGRYLQQPAFARRRAPVFGGTKGRRTCCRALNGALREADNRLSAGPCRFSFILYARSEQTINLDGPAVVPHPRVAAHCLLQSLHFPFAPEKTGDIETRAPKASLRRFDAAGSAGMVKLVDTPDLGSGAARRGSSSLSTRTRAAGSRIGSRYRLEISVPEVAAGHSGSGVVLIKTNGCLSTAATI